MRRPSEAGAKDRFTGTLRFPPRGLKCHARVSGTLHRDTWGPIETIEVSRPSVPGNPQGRRVGDGIGDTRRPGAAGGDRGLENRLAACRPLRAGLPRRAGFLGLDGLEAAQGRLMRNPCMDIALQD